MERIIIVKRSKTGKTTLRFRLKDTGNIDLYYSSSIKADAKELEKFELDGSLKPRVTRYDPSLKREIDHHISVIRNTYHKLCETYHKTNISSRLFSEAIDQQLESKPTPTKKEKELTKDKDCTLMFLYQIRAFADHLYTHNQLSENRYNVYLYTIGCLTRYLTIKKLQDITPEDVNPTLIASFGEFFLDEYEYVEKYPKLYKDLSGKSLPTQRRSSTTLATRIKLLKAFFNHLVRNDQLHKSPFDKIDPVVKKTILKEEKKDPVFLRLEELGKIISTPVPEDLQQTKDAFIVQCAFGCRIGDFKLLSMDSVKVTEEGIPYVHYLPQKTMRTNTRKDEIETPIMHFAYEIIKRTNFQFPILKNEGGHNGYNVRIKRLLQHCGIDREIKIYDEEEKKYQFMPVHEAGKSKLARSTHVDIMAKVTIDPHLSGLHSRSSRAVLHYTKPEIRDHFHRMCLAFHQPLYAVSRDLDIIDQPHMPEGLQNLCQMTSPADL